MITDSTHERQAGVKRALASNERLLGEIGDWCERTRSSAVAEYHGLDSVAKKMTDDYTTLPEDRSKLRAVLLRMKELRRVVVGSDEVAGGAKYHG